MGTELKFESVEMMVGDKGKRSTVPDLSGMLKKVNNLECHLGDKEEIYACYGKVKTTFPYQSYTCYDRTLSKKKVRTAVLENEYLRAVFLPEFGGRLWELYDKKKDENLLYTNDVIRPSNLATRNAWFSGGVEWNIGIIGHTPFTMDTVYTAQLQKDDGTPVLRMYEYERIRQVVYQMDFWIENDENVLNCRMRIENTSEHEIPMYWWSNAAVPEYESGRLLIPSEAAYTNDDKEVIKVAIPDVDGVDVTRYESIPYQKDYFFEIKKQTPKYLINANKDGYGLLHMSTDRLQSRKLFSWGHNESGNWWQAWLTEEAGPYVEVQGGLGKTQYGCIPMAGKSTWEWLEQYGPVQLPEYSAENSFEKERDLSLEIVESKLKSCDLERRLKDTESMALTKATLELEGSSFITLRNLYNKGCGKTTISPHLEFAPAGEEQKVWQQLLENHTFPNPDASLPPHGFTSDETIFQTLQAFCDTRKDCGWYGPYQLGVIYAYREDYEKACEWLSESLKKKENAWAYHALAICIAKQGEKKAAVSYIRKGIQMQHENLSYIKDAFVILLQLDAYQELLEEYELLSDAIAHEARISFDAAVAFHACGKNKEAYQILADEHFVLADKREGEDALEKLWTELQNQL